MKRFFLSLVVASPILTALVPRADAGAIARDPGALQPRLFGPASFKQRNHSGVPGSVFKAPAPRASNALNNSLLSGSTLQVSSGVVNTGATLTLNSSDSYILTLSGSISAAHGTIQISENNIPVRVTNGGLGTLNITENSGLLTSGVVQTGNGSLTKIGSGTLTLDGTNVSTGGVIHISDDNIGSGTLTLGGTNVITSGTIHISGGNVFGGRIANGSLHVNSAGGTLDFESSQTLDALSIGAGATVVLTSTDSTPSPLPIAAAPAPVPEPGTAILFAIGALAASKARRRHAV